MEVWIPGVLALVGALAGVLLSNYLSRRSRWEDDRRKRLEEALRSVVLAIAARHFSTRAGMIGKPESVEASHIEELERQMYIDNVERIFVTLRGARQAVALLVADGIDIGESWRSDETMQDDIERVYQVLVDVNDSAKKKRRR